MTLSHIRVVLLTCIGLLFLGLGLVGAFLPILPTTPFVLAGAACLTGTPKLRAKILRISFFRSYIENYQKRQGLPRKVVVRSLVYLWGMLVLSMVLVGKPWVVVLEVTVGICVTLHILHMAKPKERVEE